MFEDGKNEIQRVSDPHMRRTEMERDGVDTGVIFTGILGSASKMQDPEAAIHMFRAYNDWLVDFCSHYPGQRIGLALLAVWRYSRGGRRNPPLRENGLTRAGTVLLWDMEPMWHPCWDPLWAAVNEVELPLHFHTFPTTDPKAREQASGQVRRAALFTGVAAFQMGLIHIIAAMIGTADVFDRYPKIKVSLGESGVGWLPYALDRMDFEFEDRFRDLMKNKPSNYWQAHCKATFQYDVIGPMLVNTNNLLTEDTLMWGSDYPHTDGIWPESTKYIAEQFTGLTDAQIKKITCDNAVEFYGLN